MNWTPLKKKKPSEHIQEYLDSQKPGGRVLNTPTNRIQPQSQFPGQTPLRQTATQRPFFAGPTEVIHAPKAPDTTIHQGSGTVPNVVVTPEQPETYEWPNVDQQMADLELAQKQAHIAAFADQMAAMDAEFWRIAQNPGSMLGANESPYYSLYMKQYQQRARDRETNAYTRASEGTGGYGSSFATMAGDQAYRETMQEFDELAPTLIKSKSERMAEILQEREMLKAMGEQMNAESNTLTLPDGTTVEVTDAARELYAGYLDSFTQGTGYDTLKTAMINGGASEADADQAIAMFKKLGGATVADQISAFEKNPTLVDAEQIMADAQRNGTEKEALPKVSKGTTSIMMNALEDPEAAWSVLEIPQETWAAYNDGQRKGIVLDRAGELRKKGLITEEDYKSVLLGDMENMRIAIDDGEIDRPASEISDMIISWQNYRDRGYMTEDEYQKLLGEAAEKIDVTAMIGAQAITMGETIGKGLEKINAPEWLKKGIEVVVDYGSGTSVQPGIIGMVANAIKGGLKANAILSNFDWYRSKMALTRDQEKALKELLAHQSRGADK